MGKIDVINNATDNVVVTMNNNDGNIQIVINVIDAINGKVELSSLKPGDTFKGKNGTEYILWYFTEDGNAAVLRKDLLPTKMDFGSNNNFDGSKIDKYLNTEYLKEMESDFCAENILEHEVDLLSMDGYDDYGIIKRKVSIPTIDQYRHHRKTIGKNMKTWWYLATPDSTPSGCSSDDVRCVDSDGHVGYGWYFNDRSVRPFGVLKSSILVSPVTEKK